MTALMLTIAGKVGFWCLVAYDATGPLGRTLPESAFAMMVVVVAAGVVFGFVDLLRGSRHRSWVVAAVALGIPLVLLYVYAATYEPPPD